MKWVTRRGLHIDRTACAWLIRRFIDPAAAFAFVPADADPAALDGHTFDMRGAEYGHEGERCTFEALLARHGLEGDPALVALGRLIRDADVSPSRGRRPEAAGVAAVLTGIHLTVPDDDEKLRLTAPLYDGLYAYCRATLADRPGRRGAPRPRLSYRRRVAAHLAEDEPGGAAGGDG
jgi:hypothetical protein